MTKNINVEELEKLNDYCSKLYLSTWKSVYHTKVTAESSESAKTTARREIGRAHV